MKAMLLFFFILVGCSALDTISKVVPNKPGISASAQIGEEANKQVVIGDQNKTEIEVEAEVAEVSHVRQEATAHAEGTFGEYTNIINDTPAWVWLICILGWVLPTPMTIIKHFVRKN